MDNTSVYIGLVLKYHEYQDHIRIHTIAEVFLKVIYYPLVQPVLWNIASGRQSVLVIHDHLIFK